MKFDNVQPIVTEARAIALPLGKTIVTFNVTHCDPRSIEYARVKAKFSKPFRKLIDVDALPPEKDREVAISTFVTHCVVGWSGITANGEAVPYTPEACIDLLMQSPPLFYSLIAEAQEVDNFKPTETEEKN